MKKKLVTVLQFQMSPEIKLTSLRTTLQKYFTCRRKDLLPMSWSYKFKKGDLYIQIKVDLLKLVTYLRKLPEWDWIERDIKSLWVYTVEREIFWVLNNLEKGN